MVQFIRANSMEPCYGNVGLLVGQSVDPPLWSRLEYLNNYGWIWFVDIRGRQRMNPYDIADALNLTLAPPWGSLL